MNLVQRILSVLLYNGHASKQVIFIDVAHAPYIYCNSLRVIITLAAFQKVSEATPVLVSYTLNCVFGQAW